MQIHGLNKTTLLDYPGLVASTIFTGNCNFRCPFCHNADLVLDPMSQPLISEEEVLTHLKKRKGIVTGVCITGGEPTLQKDLREFIMKVREIGLSVKLDTNGYMPDVLIGLCEEGLIDFVAMDIKTAPDEYSKVTGVNIDISRIEKSVDYLLKSNIEYEFRTTVVQEFHNRETFDKIGQFIKGSKAYFLQGYVDSDRIIGLSEAKREGADKSFGTGMSAYSAAEMAEFKEILIPYVKRVEIRGVD